MTLTMENYSMKDEFYIVKLAEINVVLRVQWFRTLRPIATDYPTMEMGFNTSKVMRVILRGISNEAFWII